MAGLLSRISLSRISTLCLVWVREWRKDLERIISFPCFGLNSFIIIEVKLNFSLSMKFKHELSSIDLQIET